MDVLQKLISSSSPWGKNPVFARSFIFSNRSVFRDIPIFLHNDPIFTPGLLCVCVCVCVCVC